MSLNLTPAELHDLSVELAIMECAKVCDGQAEMTEQQELELMRIQKADALEALVEERYKYEELEKICRAQHEAINKCADHLREAQLALMAFIDVKVDIYQESRRRAKAKKRIFVKDE